MKLLVDMNLSPRWVSFLAASQIESAHWSRVGAVTATDLEIMAYAREHGYIVLTHDLDFSAILAATRGTKPSVVQIRHVLLAPADRVRRELDAARKLAALFEAIDRHTREAGDRDDCGIRSMIMPGTTVRVRRLQIA